ncbi:phage portal protein [Sporosarcina trichiuri]|uniref:phage portal protein n=1 Tax=Sporosarcina trichiuri TaxID=3056445 RepID=UPI0025B50428|nr:phage portal protein [Sporosarcina sp. 0.2-SM1T-5]WJY27464.1 phage portal protein [Sporosarcina sp. 0.2-SM1T-5]
MLLEDLYRPRWHERMVDVITDMVDGVITDDEVMLQEIQKWLNSDTRKNMLTGERYYLNQPDILEDKVQPIDWKSNQKLTHDFVKKLVNQKIGYLLSKEPSFGTENEEFHDVLTDRFDRGLLKKIKNVGKEAINKGIAYLYPYISETGRLSFTKFPSEQIIPNWADNEHMEVLSFCRVYEETYYDGRQEKIRTKVEFYHENGIQFFLLEAGKLIPDVEAGIEAPHFYIGDTGHNWEKIPLIHFKYNEEEQPLIDSIKELIDNYNLQASTNADLLADTPNFIYKLVNYGGQDLAEFLSDLQKYRAVKTDENGDVDKLQADIRTEAVEKELDRNRNSIYEFGRGVDTRDVNLRDASGVALRFRYSDLDMDCNILEAEFQSSIEHMLWFITHYYLMTEGQDFTEESVNVVFNRDIIISEPEAIESCEKSVGILDDKTIRENHPWYTDAVEERLKQQKAEEERAYAEYADEFSRKQAEDVSDDGE